MLLLFSFVYVLIPINAVVYFTLEFMVSNILYFIAELSDFEKTDIKDFNSQIKKQSYIFVFLQILIIEAFSLQLFSFYQKVDLS